MREARPSRTAMRLAMRRAAHQMFDHPLVLEDPIAVRIIGPDTEARIRVQRAKYFGKTSQAIRAFMAVRSRFAEDELARAVGRGASQFVILGAGLDTFAYRNPFSESTLRVFEVDYPATQGWKRKRLEEGRIAMPSSVTFAPLDFEKQTLREGLQNAGFDPAKPAFFSWLGVVMYLTEEAIANTLNLVASTPNGGGIAFDYAVPRSSLSWVGRMMLDGLSRRVAAAGEPFRTFFEPQQLATRLESSGFHSLQDLGTKEINERYFKNRADGLRVAGALGRLMSAEI